MILDVDERIMRLLNQLEAPSLTKDEVELIEKKVKILQDQKT